jgi:two-component system NarL family sensor kinase
LKTTRHKGLSREASELPSTITDLRARLADAEETLRAIRSGEVDSVTITGIAGEGPQVFTLQGADHAYQMLIESMNEGALTLTANAMILYANQCFARMVKRPLEQVIGGSFRRFLSAEDRATLQPLIKKAGKSGSKIEVRLKASDGSQLPVGISFCPLDKNGSKTTTIGMVVTDMTEARRTEELLRALSHRLVQAQESERGRVALELHDHITQLLCAIVVRSEILANNLSVRDGPAKREALQLREMLGQTVKEVERISRNLRPSILDNLGLVAVLSDTSDEFAKRTGVSLKLACVKLTARLPADIELTLYRILQEALKNVEKHAIARHVVVGLKRQGNFVQLVIKDDGIGFDMHRHLTGRKEKSGLGLLGMRERAAYVGGTLKVKSVRYVGTEIEIRIPLTARNQRV